MKKKATTILPKGFIHNRMAWLTDKMKGFGLTADEVIKPVVPSKPTIKRRATRESMAKSHRLSRKKKQAAKAAI